MNTLTLEQLHDLANRMTKFTVPQKVRVNQRFLDKLIESGEIEEAREAFPFYGIKIEIDNTISTFEFDYIKEDELLLEGD